MVMSVGVNQDRFGLIGVVSLAKHRCANGEWLTGGRLGWKSPAFHNGGEFHRGDACHGHVEWSRRFVAHIVRVLNLGGTWGTMGGVRIAEKNSHAVSCGRIKAERD